MIALDPTLTQALSGRTFVDAFAGIGAFHQALSSLGARCVFSCELDPDARAVYADNHQEEPLGDIKCIAVSDIPEHDILCAGLPCQSWSLAGSQDGFADERGRLFAYLHRVVEAKKPMVVLLENVANLPLHADGRSIAVIRRCFIELGYLFFHRVLNASLFGVPQARKRVFMLAVRRDLGSTNFWFPEPTMDTSRLRDVLLPAHEAVQYELNMATLDVALRPEVKPDPVAFGPIRVGSIGKGGQGNRIYDSLGHAVTLKSQGGGLGRCSGLYHVDGVVRRLAPREAARIMGFPDTFRLPTADQTSYRLLGNSIVLDLVQRIGLAMAEQEILR